MCLRSPVGGMTVREVNPIARWHMDLMGLEPALISEFLFTVVVLIYIARTKCLVLKAKILILTIVTILPALAAWNNFGIMVELGVWP